MSLTSWTYFALEPRTLVWMSLQNTQTGTHNIKIIATNPDGVTAEVSYKLIVDPDCSSQTLTPPTVVDQTYTTYDA